MKRALPAPLLTAVLFVLWLLLNQSVSLGHLVLAVLFALLVPLIVAPLAAAPVGLRRWRPILPLLGVVLVDNVRSNLTVARLILGAPTTPSPGFVWVPLNLRDPHGIATLAAIITMTPGTLSAALTADQSHLLVHALHVPDAQALVTQIKARYEAPLRAIFE
jgi:multicomponent K+:H+ antiporter subunit E